MSKKPGKRSPQADNRLDKLSRREREIMDSVYRRQRASCAEIQSDLKSPPSYSAVRAMVGKLVHKGLLDFEVSGKKYVYFATVAREKVRRRALNRLVHTFFDGSVNGAVVALLRGSKQELDDETLAQLERLLEERRKSSGKDPK